MLSPITEQEFKALPNKATTASRLPLNRLPIWTRRCRCT